MHFIDREVVKCCKSLYAAGIRHVSLENLTGGWGKCHAVSKEHGINFNRITKALHIAEVKDVFKHIAPKYGIAVSLIHPAYTSQCCPECGCITDKNRLTQEDFRCIECDHNNNADKIGARNTGHRLSNAVLREELLVLNDDGTGYVPKKMKYSEVKSVLSKLRTIVWGKYP